MIVRRRVSAHPRNSPGAGRRIRENAVISRCALLPIQHDFIGCCAWTAKADIEIRLAREIRSRKRCGKCAAGAGCRRIDCNSVYNRVSGGGQGAVVPEK